MMAVRGNWGMGCWESRGTPLLYGRLTFFPSARAVLFKGRVEFRCEGVEDRKVGVGSIAQRLEQGTHNPLVPGSNPGGPIF